MPVHRRGDTRGRINCMRNVPGKLLRILPTRRPTANEPGLLDDGGVQFVLPMQPRIGRCER